MLFLRTGLPGASKTLNTLKEIIEESDLIRPKYYNNIKLLLLDFDVCNSFSGFFYGYYLDTLDKKERSKINKVILRVHADDRFVTLADVPFLSVFYNPWLDTGGPFKLFCDWVFKLYTPKQTQSLRDYLSLTDVSTHDFEHIKQFNYHFSHFDNVLHWHHLPKSSIILIDECQQFFPPRPVGSKVPQHVSEFETHRHHGYDVHLVTQDAKLLDNHVRRLTGRHINYHNPLASKRVARLQSDKVFEPSDYFARKNAISTLIKRDSNYYGLYWSADLHTHKLVIPRKLIFIFIALIIFVFFIVILVFRFSASDTSDIDEFLPRTSVAQSTEPLNPIQYISTNAEQIHSSALSSRFTHPLSYCDDLTYTGRIYSVSGGKVSRAVYLQCDIHSTDKDENLVSTSYVYDTGYLSMLGYTHSFSNDALKLHYNKLTLLFPPI